MKRVFLAGAFVLIAAGAAADVVCSSSVNNVCSGGGGATTIVSGTTPITGGATTQVCFNSAGTLACGDSDFTFATDRATVTKLGTTAANAANAVDIGETAGCITFEGSSADTNEARLCVTNPTVGDGTFNLPNNAAAGSQTLAVLGLAQSWTSENTFAAVKRSALVPSCLTAPARSTSVVPRLHGRLFTRRLPLRQTRHYSAWARRRARFMS